MTQIHVVVRRVSPALKVDFVQIGRFEDGQFNSLPLDAVARTPIARFLENSDISDSLYVYHSKIADLIVDCVGLPGFSADFFDNTIVLMFDFNLDYNESPTEEKGERN